MILSGGGGWGKSLLVATYLKATQINAAWVNLDRADQDPMMFLRYIVEAIRRVYPATSDSLSFFFRQRSSNEQWQPAVSSLINAILNLAPQDVHLVLDDFHLAAESEQIMAILKHLLNYSPPNLHIILVSRRKPDLPLSRLSIDRDVIELGPEQIGFSLDEIYHLFQQTYKKRLNGHQLNLMVQYTDGWPISLRIFGETTVDKTENEIEVLLQSLTKAKESVIRYFDEEVFSHLQEDMRLFLLKTSILDRFDDNLCNFILETDNSRSFIDRILKRELFLIRLDDTVNGTDTTSHFAVF